MNNFCQSLYSNSGNLMMSFFEMMIEYLFHCQKEGDEGKYSQHDDG